MTSTPIRNAYESKFKIEDEIEAVKQKLRELECRLKIADYYVQECAKRIQGKPKSELS